MELSDKQALLLCVQALPTADVWHEIGQEETISISQQALRELARLESVELEAAQIENRITNFEDWFQNQSRQQKNLLIPMVSTILMMYWMIIIKIQ